MRQTPTTGTSAFGSAPTVSSLKSSLICCCAAAGSDSMAMVPKTKVLRVVICFTTRPPSGLDSTGSFTIGCVYGLEGKPQRKACTQLVHLVAVSDCVSNTDIKAQIIADLPYCSHQPG